MFRKKTRKRYGMTSLMEATVCLALISVIFACLISLVSVTNVNTLRAKEHETENKEINTFVDTIKSDIKESAAVSMSSSDLKIIKSKALVTYHYDSEKDTILRNGEVVINNIDSCSFQTINDNRAEVYATMNDGDIINFVVYR